MNIFNYLFFLVDIGPKVPPLLKNHLDFKTMSQNQVAFDKMTRT